MRFFAGVGALLLFCSVVRADSSPTLEDAVAQALAHSPEVAIAQAHVSYAESKAGSAHWGFFHPEIRVFAGDNAVTGTKKAGVQVSQDLMRFLTFNGDEVRQTQRDLAVARQTLTIARQRVIRQVAEALGRLRLVEDLVQVNAEAVAEQNKLLVLAKSQFDAGTGTTEHLVTLQQALVKARHALGQAEEEQWQARVVLSQLLGGPLPASEASP